ncbi:MAG: hypothetical protein CL989_00010 [Euryarchaeota archaeon]|nr:hypothetical protein [Euryarchaeota archaeon]
MEEAGPRNTTISSGGFDEAKAGFYASIGLGAAVLAYAIYYVTFELTAESDHSYLILGGMLGTVAVGCIGFHEWRRSQEGEGRNQNMVEDYVAATAVLSGALASIWLSRYSAFALKEFGAYDGQFIEGQWAPTVELAIAQTIFLLLVMEISTRMIHRHNLGTLPRTIVILAPISLSLSAVSIWVDYAGGVFEQLNTISHVLLLSAAMIHALRLDRSILYLISAGASMAIPALVVLSLGVESGGWMTIMVVIVGMTATDRGLSREMIEQSSWFVIFGILLLQIVASVDQADFVLGSFSITEQPFGLSFWLWAALLVGWFAPTTMQRTPAMPIGLALALSLLEAEAALIAWVVGIGAFVYLETRDHARDWVVRSTYWAMVVAWFISAAIASSQGGVFLDIGSIEISNAHALGLGLLPVLIVLGIWSESRGRFNSSSGSSVAILAGALVPLSDKAGEFLPIVLIIVALVQLRRTDIGRDENEIWDEDSTLVGSWWNLACIPILALAISIVAIRDRGAVPLEFAHANLLPLVVGLAIYAEVRSRKRGEASILLTPFGFTSLFLVLASMLAVPGDIGHSDGFSGSGTPDGIILEWRLAIFHIAVAGSLLVAECGAMGRVSPLHRLAGAVCMAVFAIISATQFNANPEFDGESVRFFERVLRDIVVVAPLVVVDRMLKTIEDLSDEARTIGSFTLLSLIAIGATDVSGGLLAIPVFAIVAYRATTHVNTWILLALPIAAAIYAGILTEGIAPEMTLVYVLDNIPFLGEESGVMDIPRWGSLLLMLQIGLSAYAIRVEDRPDGDTRWGAEERFSIGIAGVLAFALLIPDFRLVWIVIAAGMWAWAWMNGIIWWFNVAPLSFVFGVWTMLEWMQDNSWIGVSGNDIFAIGCLMGAVVSGIQIVIQRSGLLARNYNAEDIQLEEYLPEGWGIEKSYDPVALVGLTSRAWMYFLLWFAWDIGYVTWVISSVIMTVDGIVSGREKLLYLGILLQTIAWPAMERDLGVNEETLLLIPILQCLALIYIVWKGPSMIGKISISEKGEELSKFSSVWALVAGYVYSIAGHGLILPALVLTISAHHSMLGFSRDESWRRGFGLIGMPLGFMVVPSQNDLVFVVMLFAAAMSLVGQGVLYASRGGLGIGTAKESSEVIREDIGLKKTDESGGAPAEEAQEDKMDIEPDADEAEAEDEDVEPEEIEGEDDDDQGGPSPPPPPVPVERVNIGDGRYESSSSALSVDLHPEILRGIRSSIPEGTDGAKWRPVLRVAPNGSMSVQWEPIQ